MRNKVLFIDNDDEDLDILMVALDSLKFTEYKMFNCPTKMFEYLENLSPEELPEIIVTDYNMPRLTGCELILEVKNTMQYYDIKFLVLSTSQSIRFKEDCLQAGALEFKVKPDSLDDYQLVLGNILGLLRAS